MIITNRMFQVTNSGKRRATLKANSGKAFIKTSLQCSSTCTVRYTLNKLLFCWNLRMNAEEKGSNGCDKMALNSHFHLMLWGKPIQSHGVFIKTLKQTENKWFIFPRRKRHRVDMNQQNSSKVRKCYECYDYNLFWTFISNETLNFQINEPESL